MKLINVYKQDNINWFNHKHLFGYLNKLHEQRYTVELESWIKHPHLNITKRKPNEAN